MSYLKTVCKDRKVTFQNVADKLGVSKQYISSIAKESSTASVKRLKEIAQAIAELSGDDPHVIFCEIIGCR